MGLGNRQACQRDLQAYRAFSGPIRPRNYLHQANLTILSQHYQAQVPLPDGVIQKCKYLSAATVHKIKHKNELADAVASRHRCTSLLVPSSPEFPKYGKPSPLPGSSCLV